MWGGDAWVHCSQPAAVNVRILSQSQNAQNGRAKKIERCES